MRVVLGIKLEGVSYHKFLGLTLVARYNGIAQVDAVLASARNPHGRSGGALLEH